MQLEAVGRVAVGDLRLEVGGQVDNVDGIEGALFGADAAANAQPFADEGNPARWVHFDAELAGSYHGAGLLALLPSVLWSACFRLGLEFRLAISQCSGSNVLALARFAFVCIDERYTGEFVAHLDVWERGPVAVVVVLVVC